jgi:dethiobiotin synthetase/adenosylmethionine--8-amino-7-oxononanoate aminotransferase
MGPHAAVAAGFSAGTNDFVTGGTEGVAHRGTAFPVAEGGGAAAASGPPFWAHTTFAWRRATGPQAAVAEEGRFVSDEELLRSVTHHLAQFADAVGGGGFGSSTGLSFGSSTDVATGDISSATSPDGFALVETAGGACSPGPSGSLQCDLMRPMRLPAVLVGDGQLGGISTTIAAYEALDARGYDVAAIILADGGHGNAAALARYCESVAPPSAGASPPPVFTLPIIPPRDVSLFATMNDDSGNPETKRRATTARRFSSGWTTVRASSTPRWRT